MLHSTIRLALLSGLALALAAGTPVRAQEASTAEQTVDVMNKLWGQHPGLRANHAKGVVVEGTFTPSKEGSALSKASIFAGPAVPVTVRFSDSTGLPALPDGSASANPHGMSLKFKLAEGGEMDVVANSLKFFPVANGEEFLQLLTAVSQSGPDAPAPKPVDTFFASHPAAPAAFGSAKTPSSFARQTYNGVNAFVLVDKNGKRQPFRYRFVPVAGEELIDGDTAAKQGNDFLMQEIVARLGKGPVSFKVLAQLAEAGDPTNDATRPWPDARKTVDLGTITLTKAVPDSKEAEKALLFMPNALTDGIEVSDDPLIDARVQAYAVSFSRRQQ